MGRASDRLVRLLGGTPATAGPPVADPGLRALLASSDGLAPDQLRMVTDLIAAQQRTVREVMVPRTEVCFLAATDSVVAALRDTGTLPHSRYPVIADSQDDVIGVVHLRDLVHPPGGAARAGLRVADVAREVARLPESKGVLAALSELRHSGSHLAVVVDEYGGTAGIVTLEDLIEEVVGDIRDEYDGAERDSDARTLGGGDVEVDGLLNLDDFAEATGVALPPGPYETAAGFLVARLGHLPRLGETADVGAVVGEPGTIPPGPVAPGPVAPGPVARLTVTRLDGRRAARIQVTLLVEPPVVSVGAAAPP